HRPIGALDHQVENAIFPPELAAFEIRDESEHDPEAHQRESRREPHHDDDHDEAEHQEAEGWIAHFCRSPPMPRWRAISSISFARSMASLRDASSTYSLCANVSSTTPLSPPPLTRLVHSPLRAHLTQHRIS